MALGAYWFFSFPHKRYYFKWAKFTAGLGGHADRPAAITLTFFIANPASCLAYLKEIQQQFPYCTWAYRQQDNAVEISLSGYQLFDYHFLAITAVEHWLSTQNISDTECVLSTPFQYLTALSDVPYYATKVFTPVAGFSQLEHQAELALLRLDCHLAESQARAFIAAFKNLAKEAGCNLSFFLESSYKHEKNLMLFLGRGYLLTQPLTIDIPAVENQMQKIMRTYSVSSHFAGDWQHYPKSERHVLIDTDALLQSTQDNPLKA
ncbi:hypothetical protein VQ643_10645 [Pseudomonas sp. F1_0610]|uniref:hypothetical protein n=1 Tax=Pseudomonas sp. F1_0610 TaxID=3114284 RepID=UPI0039C33280